MLVIALTGGIGSGKSAVSRHFESLGVPVLDADLLAHQLVKPGFPALLEIQAVFGDQMVDAQGRLNRAALRAIVFGDPQQRHRLEAILHPRIRQTMEAWLEHQSAPYVVLVIPLLFETGQTTLADRVLVVDCDESLQIERVAKRDRLSTAQIAQIIASQVDRQTRLRGADDVIENNGTLDTLIEATERLHQTYLKLAG
ncbi:MAG: dephospho-CoA kinase [Candidatus Thiodiazotropha sp. (ex Lucinoma kastoroae)]|nr:dephospho-CoA kinase [Candidatus Thiodiazotropha sp. (ex Rostrolucina anterorostrata)]MCU7861066.1 dephospho-CoA kinase [Candidatus Thiodiazotropha sp. (ex Lucinoma kastoroae)]